MASWIKAFLITPVITWVVLYLCYRALGFTPFAYVLSSIPGGIISGIVFYILLPKYKITVAVISFAALYIFNQYFPATSASGDLQAVSSTASNVYLVAAFVGLLIAFFSHKKFQADS